MFKEYTTNDFTQKCTSEVISAYGKKDDINLSSILTRLIQSAGRYCRSFASDLFISWECFLCDLANDEPKPAYLFGMREMGVDHDAFIMSRYNTEAYARYEYLQMWRLVVEKDEDGWYSVHLYEIQRP